MSAFAADRLRSFVLRIERLEEEVKELNSDKSEVYKEAKGEGFDTKILKEVVRRRRLDTTERQEHDAILDLYESAVMGTNGGPKIVDPLD